MKFKASRNVRIGNRTFRRGAEVTDISATRAREVGAKGYLEGDVPEEQPQDQPLDKLTVDQLKALAAERKIDLGDASKKADIIAAIELATEGA